MWTRWTPLLPWAATRTRGTSSPCPACVIGPTDIVILLLLLLLPSGSVSTSKLRDTILAFGLTIDIDALIRETDTDASGFIDFEEFQVMMTGE